MKKIFKSDFLWYVLLFFIWILPGFGNNIHTETIFSFLAFIISAAVLAFVKEEKIKYSAFAIITVVISIYDYRYLILSLPVLLLISMSFAFREEKGKTVKYDTFNTIYIAAIVFKLLYCIFSIVKADFLLFSRIPYFFKNSFVVIAVLIFLLCSGLGFKQSEKEKSKKLTNIYILALIGIILDIFILYAITSRGALQGGQFYMMYWYIFILVELKSENLIVKASVEKLGKLFCKLF